MSAPNGHAAALTAVGEGNKTLPAKKKRGKQPATASSPPTVPNDQSQEFRTKLLDELQVPFDPSLVKWRAHETMTAYGSPRGYCLPYSDPRAYKDRLNLLVTPVGWTDRYEVATTAKKILITCELHVHGLGTHSATGEEWSNASNAS